MRRGVLLAEGKCTWAKAKGLCVQVTCKCPAGLSECVSDVRDESGQVVTGPILGRICEFVLRVMGSNESKGPT